MHIKLVVLALMLVSAGLMASPQEVAVTESDFEEELTTYLQYEADMCLQAKQRLMEAETDEAFEVAMRRVSFLCDD